MQHGGWAKPGVNPGIDTGESLCTMVVYTYETEQVMSRADPVKGRGRGRVLNDEAVAFIREQIGEGVLTVTQVAETLEMCQESIRRLVRGETYRHVKVWKRERVEVVREPGLEALWKAEEERVERVKGEVREFRAPKLEAGVEYEEDEPAWLKQMKGGRVEG